MKKLLVISFLAVMTFAACQQKKESPTAVAETGTFACPMKCEGEKTYAVAGKCPVCKMDLVAVDGQAAAATYEMQLVSTPDLIEAGKPVKLAFTPRKAGDPASQIPLDEVHDHKIHVIVVSKDLSWYNHIHPVYQADGSYVIEQNFPAGGEFIIFSDYQPTGAGNQVHRSSVMVTGVTKPAATYASADLVDETDGYTVKLMPQGDRFVTNNLNHMGVEVTENGKPVTDFETFMGAKGHLVIISADGQHYLHVHPDEVDGKLDLHTQFDQPGLYRAFFQFQTKGKMHTSYFTLDVKEGKAGEVETGHDHSHDHGDDTHTH